MQLTWMIHIQVGPQPPKRSSKGARPEMKGPSDIGDILSGLKTKTVNVSNDKKTVNVSGNDGSTVSIQDLKEMSNAKIPSRSSKRSKSNKTSISLDI